MTVTYSDFDMSDMIISSPGSGTITSFLVCKSFVLYGWKSSNKWGVHDPPQNSAEVSL